MDKRFIKNPPVIKKRTSKEGYEIIDYHCPSCGVRMFSTKNCSSWGERTKYCADCGQAITWKGIKIELPWPLEEMD